MTKLIQRGTQEFLGMNIPVIEGGFGEGQKVMLAKTVAKIHGVELRKVNELINNNIDEFEFGIDLLDLKGDKDFEVLAKDSEIYTTNALNSSKYIYLLSEQGYFALVQLMRTEKAKEIRKQLRREYFAMRTALQQRPMDSYMIEDPGKRAERWIEERKEYEQEKQKRIEAEAIIEEQKPKIEYYDKVMSDKHLITTTCIAKAFGMSAKKLNHILNEQGLIYKQGNAWYLYSKWENNGLAKLVPVETKGGIRYQLLWTEKGKQGIYGLLKALNYIELATINTEYLFG